MAAKASLVAGLETAKCAVCGLTNNLKRCAKCKIVSYCSRKHQISDWATHKATCGKESQNNAGDKRGQVTENQQTDSDTDSDEIPFDTRPYKSLTFQKPPSYDLDHLPQYVATKLKDDGCCVIDGAVTEVICSKIFKEVLNIETSGSMMEGQLAGGRTSGDDLAKVVNSKIRSDKIMWLCGDEKDRYPSLCELIVETMDALVYMLTPHLDGKYYISNRTKAMVACYPGNGTSYHRHIDNPQKDGRCITCIFYLNKDWDVEKNGGLLRILPKDKEEYIDVEPIMNRLLLFWSDGRNPHEVHPAYDKRYAITVWYFDEKERELARQDEVEKKINDVRGEIAMLDVRRKQLEKATLEQEIENKAREAVNKLSEEELQAITEIVKTQPNPRDVLSQLGIADSIQTYLLKVIKERLK